jgi:hypothetical protein
MTGKVYYITTLDAWRRHSARFANSHFIVLNAPHSTDEPRILALIEADEGVHLDLEAAPDFEALPHPLAQRPISDSAQAALATHGVAPGANTFDASEALARVHPLLKHRVF